jgi:putative tryptophan/tyrosine transport system substrate-binding protein
MRRREFITGLGGWAAWPLAVWAQQPAIPLIGFLNGATEAGWAPFEAAFHQGLNEAGYVEGHNLAIEYRWAEDHYDRLPALAADLVRRRVNVIAATTTPAALAAKEATREIPVVFTAGFDPIAVGLVASLNRPGANVTGASLYFGQLAAKRLELLHQLIPKSATIGVLLNPNISDAGSQWKDVQEAARVIGHQVHAVQAGSEDEFDKAFATFAQLKAGALLVGLDVLFISRRRLRRGDRHFTKQSDGDQGKRKDWQAHRNLLLGGLDPTFHNPELGDAHQSTSGGHRAVTSLSNCADGTAS